MDVELYAVTGPYLEVIPYIGFDANATANPLCWWWDLYAGIEANLGIQAHILDYNLFDYNTNLAKYEMTLAEDSTCVTNEKPIAIIENPKNDSIYNYGESIQFTGSASDNEDGPLSGSSLVWTSDNDGQIGTGTSFSKDDLSINNHKIILTATDSD